MPLLIFRKLILAWKLHNISEIITFLMFLCYYVIMFTNFCVNNQQCCLYKAVKINLNVALRCRKKTTYERTKIIVCIYLFSFHTTTDEINLFRNFLLRIFWLVSIASKNFLLRYLNHPKIQHLSFLHQNYKKHPCWTIALNI